MDSGLIRTVPSALAGAATGLGYAHDVMVLLSVSQYIRNLGYSAVKEAQPFAHSPNLDELVRDGVKLDRYYTCVVPNFCSTLRF